MNAARNWRQNFFLPTLILVAHGAFAQSFVNLDFEGANLSGYGAGSVPTTNAIPGWQAYIGGTSLANINYNVGGSGGIEVSLIGANNIQGNYYILIQGASIGQTGTIPATAQSLIWWGSVPNSVSFNGQELSFSAIGSGPHYSIFAANISALAGQTGQLLFASTTYPNTPGFTIDNIQFSSSPVPEPGVFSLLTLGGLGFLWRRRKA